MLPCPLLIVCPALLPYPPALLPCPLLNCCPSPPCPAHKLQCWQLTNAVLEQGKSSRTFKDELGYVGSEEIIHRNNICLLSIVSSLNADPNQDGTPDPTPDEPPPTKIPPPAYSSMTSQAGIPGLTNQAWPHEQQNAGFHQDSYAPASLPAQSQAGTTGVQSGFGANPEAYWHQQPQVQQQQQQHYGGNSQIQPQAPGHLSAAAPHNGPQGGVAPGLHHQPVYQQEWHGISGGNTSLGIVKQEPGPQHSFGALPHRNPTLGSTSAAPAPNPTYASPAFGAEGKFPPGDPRHVAYDPFPQSSSLTPPGTSLPPNSSFPPTSTSARIGQSDLLHQPPQQGYQGMPGQTSAAPPSQAYASGYPQRDAKAASAGMCP